MAIKTIAYLDANNVCVNAIIAESDDVDFLDLALEQTESQFGAVSWVVCEDDKGNPIGLEFIDGEFNYPVVEDIEGAVYQPNIG